MLPVTVHSSNGMIYFSAFSRTLELSSAMASSSNVELKNFSGLKDKDGAETGLDNPVFRTDRSNETLRSTGSNDNMNGPTQQPRHRHTSSVHGASGNVADLKLEEETLGACGLFVHSAQRTVTEAWRDHRNAIIRTVQCVLLLLYFAYFAYALYYRFGDEGSLRLLACTLFGVFILCLKLAWGHISRFAAQCFPSVPARNSKRMRKICRWALYVGSTVAMVTLLIVLVALRTPGNLLSLAGLAGFIAVSYVTSVSPARVNWHPVFWGFSLQFYFAVIILRTQWGFQAFSWLGSRVSEFIDYAAAGAVFVFGESYNDHFFAFSVMPMIVFMSAVISVLYYLGVMQAIVNVIGRFLAFCLGTTPAESLVASANIFMGMTDAPLLVRPFVARMTKSELHAIMTGGFATIAGSVLGAYIGFGVPANHLLSASVMSAPAALAISKLTYPETEERLIEIDEYASMGKSEERNLIEAASAGATWSIGLVGNVLVNVMAFLSILKFVNATLTWFGDRVGVEGLSFELICSYVLYPVALFMGTEPRDCRRVAELVGIKTFTNEFIAYVALQKYLQNGENWANYTSLYNASDPTHVEYTGDDVRLLQWNVTLEKGYMTRRSEVIATYALCGFSNFGSMGILLGGLSAMAPDRKHDMAAIVLRAMIAGNIACFFTACIAGLFFEEYE
ncbi:hypothetical protein BaRGS_00029509 [Batillaria attramentaria]|uniref:Sodium/nucleoside cotransporter n=1 Tax=Batillaria attramentaria TaxID=370345 RepID=A0ABD0JX20_9CAEN